MDHHNGALRQVAQRSEAALTAPRLDQGQIDALPARAREVVEWLSGGNDVRRRSTGILPVAPQAGRLCYEVDYIEGA